MRKKQSKLLLFDTHIWLWLLNGEERVKSSKKLALIEKTAKDSGIKVSVISVWEVGMLESKGRILLPCPIQKWIKQALSAPGISLAPLTEEIAIESSRLPGDFHGDPADRILVATARNIGASLLTCDKEILAYSKKQNFRAFSL